MKTTLALSITLSMLLPLAAAAGEPGTTRVRNATLGGVRQEAIALAHKLEDSLIAYEAPAAEIALFRSDLRGLVERDERYFTSDVQVADVGAFELRMAMRMANRLSGMQEVVSKRFEVTRRIYCDRQWGVMDFEGEEMMTISYVPKPRASAEKAAMFCTIHIPRIVPFM